MAKQWSFFIEGTRSRSGKSLPPRVGVLKIILDVLASTSVEDLEDVVVVPVSLSYERMLEEGSYADEMMGTPKPGETLSNLFKSLGFLQHRFGGVNIVFNDPISLRGNNNIGLVADKILASIESNCIITATALVASALLRLHSPGEYLAGIPFSVLVAEVERLRSWVLHLRLTGAGLAPGFVACSGDRLVEHAIAMVPSVLTRTAFNNCVCVYASAKAILQLQIYENQLFTVFGIKALQEINKNSNIDLFNLLRYEFPVAAAATAILRSSDATTQDEPPTTLPPLPAGYLASLVAPYIETYWLVSLCFCVFNNNTNNNKNNKNLMEDHCFRALQVLKVASSSTTTTTTTTTVISSSPLSTPSCVLHYRSFTPIRETVKNAVTIFFFNE
eukprot:PhM_4_TR16131/c0_g1_i1/m.88159/K00649/GNPAT; glyceronephosphate O-acyltransferase